MKAVVYVVIAILCVSLAGFSLPPRRAAADQPKDGGVNGRFQIVHALKRIPALDKDRPSLDASEPILLDTQTGESWNWELKDGNVFWRKITRD